MPVDNGSSGSDGLDGKGSWRGSTATGDQCYVSVRDTGPLSELLVPRLSTPSRLVALFLHRS